MANTKLLLSDLAASIEYVPSKYVRPMNDRPNLDEVQSSLDGSIPLIDLQGLHALNRSHVIRQIADACQTDGFFQVQSILILYLSFLFFGMHDSLFYFIFWGLSSGQEPWNTRECDSWHAEHSKGVFSFVGK